jgi:tetratricopeptide (TPR) repeat protein
MDGRFFISYSRGDAAEFAGRLADRLVAGPPSYSVWLDVRDERPGMDWDNQLRDAILTCPGLLFLMTRDSVQDNSACKLEWVWALKYKKPVIPLRVDADAELPFRLSSRQYIDFSGGFEAGLAKLRIYLGWMGSPEWVLQDLRDQLTEAERELQRADLAQRPRIEQDIQELRDRIVGQERLLADPEGATRRTEERIAAGLERERQPERPPVASVRAKFVNTPPVIAPGYFQDRHVESELVGDFLRADDARMMTVVGRGGVGKTAMVCRLLKALEGGHLPDDLGELAVDGIVYLSPAGAHPVNFPNLFADLCRLLPPETADRLLQRYRDPHETLAALMRALLDAIPSGRVVALLDNAEDVIDARSGEFGITDATLDEALRALLSAPAHGVKVILTTRVAPRGLLLVQPERQRRLDLDEGLDSPYAEQVLRARDPDGRLGLKTASDDLLGRARERTRGYPRALEALTAILAADRNTTLPELLAETAELPGNVVDVLVGEAFSRLDGPAQQVMQALAIYTVPVPPVAVDYLLQPYRAAVDAAPVLSRLVNMQFVRREAGRYHLHQVDRDYALGRVPAGEPADRDADPVPFTQQALRHRGADYFEQTRTPREDWKTLDDLAPQRAEFELRYQGQDYDAAAQVLLGIDSEYLIRWGHYRLVCDMYQRLQGHLTDPRTDAGNKHSLGVCYRLLGEFRPAIDLLEQALDFNRTTGDLLGQSANLGALATCYYQVGQTTRAIGLLEQALAIADDIGYQWGKAAHLSHLSICYKDLGRILEAIKLNEQALDIDRAMGNREDEAADLGNLGDCHQILGQTARAIGLYEQTLAIGRQIGDRYTEALALVGLGYAHGDFGAWSQAVKYSGQAIDLADAISSMQAQSDAYCLLARIHLLAGELPAAQHAAIAARGHDYPPNRAASSLLLGIVQLRQDHPAEAAREFGGAVARADELLEQASGAYAALDTKALALCGLALTTDPDKAAEAAAAFRAARAITNADGTVRATLALFDALAAADRGDILAGIRSEAEGRAVTDEPRW